MKGKAAKKDISEKLFPELLANVGTDAYETTLKKFEKYGIPTHDVESIAQTYIRSNLQFMDVLKDASPEVADALKLNPAHLPYLYRLNMGGRIEADHLSYLTKLNTPASWELRQNGNIRARLESLLSGGTPNRAEFFTMPGGNPYWTERSVLKEGFQNKKDVVQGRTVLNSFNPRDNTAVGGAFATAGKETPTPAGINTGVPGGQQGINSMLATAQGPTPNPFGAPANVVKPDLDPEAVEKAFRGKVVPLSLLENKNYPGVNLERAKQFGITINAKPDTALPAADVTLSNQGAFGGMSSVGKSRFSNNPLDVPVNRAAAEGGIAVPARLPKGAQRVVVSDKQGVEEAKAVLI